MQFEGGTRILRVIPRQNACATLSRSLPPCTVPTFARNVVSGSRVEIGVRGSLAGQGSSPERRGATIVRAGWASMELPGLPGP